MMPHQHPMPPAMVVPYNPFYDEKPNNFSAATSINFVSGETLAETIERLEMFAKFMGMEAIVSHGSLMVGHHYNIRDEQGARG